MNYKQKIINDPVHGFINIPSNLAAELIEHRYVQRLRNIKQLSLSYLVYPGACHNRFQHALGAMYLMIQTIDVLRSKGCEITDEEAEAAVCAILLHDIGHGPFSHSLEYGIINEDVGHEEISAILMHEINMQMDGRLYLAIAIFNNTYHKKFLHQLVSSQLDVDRLDYLSRDSFFSGVAEGMIGLGRIIKMLNVVDDELVVEAKGIYSIEKFLISRHLMYWQVYLHKTVLAAEKILVNILRRAKELSHNGEKLFATPALQFFLNKTITLGEFRKYFNDEVPIEHFINLSDCDIESAIKVWRMHKDFVLSQLCKMLTNRKLFRCELSENPFNPEKIEAIRHKTQSVLNITDKEVDYFVNHEAVSSKAYTPKSENIKILYPNGNLVDISNVSAMLTAAVFSAPTTKYALCYCKNNSKI
ncbi:MAG: HD domain-containing protein [Prevotellaceae bacterium]|jgi:HD superfamily phosphohydrolase|nr:HD domain-containing protein [Prevotellaceae bacterium]